MKHWLSPEAARLAKIDRRKFLKLCGLPESVQSLLGHDAPAASAEVLSADASYSYLSVSERAQMPMQHPASGQAAGAKPQSGVTAGKADFTLHIAPVLVGLSRETTITTTGYNGVAPGPILKMTEGKRTTVDVLNDTDTAELVHWHGQLIPSEVDGSVEEGTPVVPPHRMRRYVFTPKPAGTRWYHSQTMAGPDLTKGLYSGQFGFVYVQPKSEPGNYDHEAFLALREWQPYFSGEEDGDVDFGSLPPPAKKDDTPNGLEIGYRAFSINDKSLYSEEPLKVKMGDRVMFRFLNASATEMRKIALSGHKFLVQALDGNAVPNPQALEVLQLAPAERIDAIVEMNNPGIWILGTTDDGDRNNGMGMTLQYAMTKGDPKWIAPPKTRWDYTLFGNAGTHPEPDERFELTIGKINGGHGKFNQWLINDRSFPKTDALRVRPGRRYRLAFKNITDDAHPMHLHRHLFELVSIDGKPTAGIMKDTVVVRPYGTLEADFVANNPGPTLIHCHQQVHMDFGLMAMLQYS